MVVRCLLGKPAEQAQAAATIIEQDAQIWISPVILAESYFVLLSVYLHTRVEIVDVLIQFINRENIRVSGIDKALAVEARHMCRDSGRVKLADALLWAEARTSGETVVFTFDRRFPTAGMTLSESL
jgi:predicted nucleic-acid-binding protein